MPVNKADFTDALVAAGLPIIGVRSDYAIIWQTEPTAQQQARANQIRNSIATQDPTSLEEAMAIARRQANRVNKLYAALVKKGVFTREEADALD